MTIVDIHPHVVSNDTERFPISPLGGKRSDWSHERSVDAENLIQSMAEAGVDLAAVVHSSTTYGFECDYVADTVARYGDRLTGVFSVNVLEPNAPAMMKKWFELGLTGMRIFSRGSTMSDAWLALDDPRVFPCYAYAQERGIPVATNVQVPHFAQQENVVQSFPGVNFILDHLGKSDFSDGAPFTAAEPLKRLARFPNLYLKVTTRKFMEADDGKSTSESQFKMLVSEFGADRMAWGSNYPANEGSLAEMLAMARKGLESLSAQDRGLILGGTALKLYPALAAKVGPA